ncbi:MAG TPA: RusA family crossover junction endodeoxyribonuclease [Chloroflexota bacterium]|nr:RusA family crossover junction endodeoxyribonuclease [Chloroflexota bacterium]
MGDTDVNVTLPYPPSSNRYWRTDRGGRPHLSDEAKAYKLDVLLFAVAAGLRPLEGPVRLTLTIFRPRRAGDLSNRIKILEDALNGIAWGDDKQIVELHAYRKEDKTNPRAEVTIEQYLEETA